MGLVADYRPMNITLCLTDNRPEPWMAGFRALWPEAQVTAWAPGAPQADFGVVWAPPQTFLDEQAAGLRALFNIGAGVDALLKRRLPSGVPVVRLDDAGMSVQMAEFVTHAVIRQFRELGVYQAEMAQGRWAYRKPLSRADFRIGVMGLGVLGERVAKSLQLFEFPVRGYSRSPRSVAGVDCFSGPVGGEGFNAFLQDLQVLICLLPLTAETEGILNRDSLSRLAPGGHLINVARGGHLVEEDLIPLLDSGRLGGATLDVFRTEPLPADHPFWRDARLTLTPHTSARTLREESIAQIVGKMQALLRGQPIAGVVDPGRGY